RICFVGDSLINGTGDHAFLGWPGRVCRREVQVGHDITCYNLGIRAETTEMIRARWRAECTPRLLDIYPGALVFSFGTNDTAAEAGKTRVEFDRSLENARAMIGEAMDWKPTLWIGPPPIDERRQPFQAGPGSPVREFRNARIAKLSDSFAAMAADMGVPYLDLFTPLSGDSAWNGATGDGVHPPDDGYALIAERVTGWEAWRRWFPA
ncbi:MAG: lipase, partial [Rhodospirillales bacterium CG15_BIG_FIL_POST_REV_8_21_14_020_66_15]